MATANIMELTDDTGGTVRARALVVVAEDSTDAAVLSPAIALSATVSAALFDAVTVLAEANGTAREVAVPIDTLDAGDAVAARGSCMHQRRVAP